MDAYKHAYVRECEQKSESVSDRGGHEIAHLSPRDLAMCWRLYAQTDLHTHATS